MILDLQKVKQRCDSKSENGKARRYCVVKLKKVASHTDKINVDKLSTEASAEAAKQKIQYVFLCHRAECDQYNTKK